MDVSNEMVLNERYIKRLESRTKPKNSTSELDKPFYCDFCRKRFWSKQEKTTHLLVHTGEKPFECEMCYKKFSQKGNLENHYIVHFKQSLNKDNNISSSSKRQLHQTPKQKIINKYAELYEYACGFCEKKFPGKAYLSVHLRVHTKEKPFECTLCLKRFSQIGNLKTHTLIHSKRKPFECDVCQKGFSQKGNLQTHYKIHTKEKQFECQLCHKKFTQKGNLLSHEKGHQEAKNPYKCDFCPKTYKDKVLFKKHLQKHSFDKTNVNEVKLIGKTNKISMNENTDCEHVEPTNLAGLEKKECPMIGKIVDVTKYVCVICGESFDKNQKLNLHYKVHLVAVSGKKSQIVGKQSSSNTNIVDRGATPEPTLPPATDCCVEIKELETVEHMQDSYKSNSIAISSGTQNDTYASSNILHNNQTASLNVVNDSLEKLPILQKDSSTDGSSSDLIDYVIDTKDMSFICGKCGKRFSGKPSFLIHYRIHSGMRLYKCGVCNKKFNQNQSLKIHLKIHSGEKPFKCDICDKSFRQKPNLMLHLRVHTGEKPYQCEICKKCFPQKSALKIHLCTRHSEKQHLDSENSEQELCTPSSDERGKSLPKLILRKQLDVREIYCSMQALE